jgi:hypothetical protein
MFDLHGLDVALDALLDSGLQLSRTTRYRC